MPEEAKTRVRIHPDQERKLREIAQVAFDALVLPPPIRVSQWAEENRFLSMEASAQLGRWINRPFQSEPMDCLTPDSPYQQVVLMFASQLVKCLAMDTPVPVVGGTKTIGEIEIGDQVFDAHCNPTQVTAVSEVHHGHECYRVGFSDGTLIVADAGHLWHTETLEPRGEGVKTTVFLRNTLRANHSVPARPGESVRRTVVSVEPVDSVPVKCIHVASPGHLFLAGEGMVPTHNSECIVNFLGYIIDRDPGPVLIVEPRELDAKAFSKDRMQPMFRDCPVLHGKVRTPGRKLNINSRETGIGNTILHKKFIGGHVSIVGANSPAGLAMRPIRYLLLDEVDRYPASAGNEGDPVMLAMRRTDEFVWNKKILMCSTPTMEGLSRIALAYEDSDQRRPHVPCPLCGEFQELDFYRLEWDKGKPETAAYRCLHCQKPIPHFRQPWMLSRGKWVITRPESRIAGFWLSQMYSTRRTWPDLAAEFAIAHKNPDTLRVFVNTCLAQTWKEKGEAPDWQRLYERAEPYPKSRVPEGGLFLTAGADVQEDRIEVMVTAWGRDKQSWMVDYIVIEGSVRQRAPLTLPDGTKVPAVWDRLAQVVNTTWEHERGISMPLVMLAIDSGWATQEVYSWARQMGPGKVMVVRGSDTVSNRNVLLGTAIAADINFAGKKIPHATKMWPVNTSLAKHEFYGWLRLEKPTIESGDPYPPGYCHFPQMNEQFFRMLTAEALEVKVDRRGYRSYHWVKHGRNESLDCFVYARAAAHRFGLDRFGVREWRALDASLQRPADAPASPQPAAVTAAAAETVPEERREAQPPTATPAAPVQRTVLGQRRGRGSIYTPKWSGWS